MRHDGGSASVLTVLLLPLLVLALAAAIDLGMLRVSAAKARAAVDLAAVVAVNDQDDDALASRGTIRLAGDAEAVAREYLARNLTTLGPSLAASAADVAARADIVVLPEGGVDPRDGTTYAHPTVRVLADVPLRTGLLHASTGGSIRPVTTIRALAVAAAR